jgi:hypothetical protein
MVHPPIGRVLEWSRTFAWRTFERVRPPADEIEIAEAGSQYGALWSTSLTAMYRAMNGEQGWAPDYAGQLTPHGFIYSVRDSAAVANTLRQALGASRGGVAGEWVTSGFSTEMIPIAGLDGTHVVVDVRAGGKHGSVLVWDDLLGDRIDIRWSSLDAYFGRVADALERGEQFEGWSPRIEDGMLLWDHS